MVLCMGSIVNHDVYYKLYISKKNKELIKNGKFCYELIGIDSLKAPWFHRNEFEDGVWYYFFDGCEFCSEKLGDFLARLYLYDASHFSVSIGYDEENVSYRILVRDKKVTLNGKDIYTYQDRYLELKRNIIDFNKKIQEYDSYIDDNFSNEVIPHNSIDLYDFDKLARKLGSTNSMLLFELPYMEEVYELMKIAEPKIRYRYEEIVTRESPKNNKPFVFETVYVMEDEDKNVKKKDKGDKKKSLFSSSFDKEADLWGLSQEDRKRAREEGFSPADYVEAEERDDDELLDDE